MGGLFFSLASVYYGNDDITGLLDVGAGTFLLESRFFEEIIDDSPENS